MISLKRLGILYPPTCVGLGYGLHLLMLRSFSWQCGIDRFRSKASRHRLSALDKVPDLPGTSAYGLEPGYPSPGRAILLRPSITRTCRYRNMNRFSIDYAFRPRLRCRLTLGGITWPRKPWAFGVWVSRPLFVTHANILTSLRSTDPFDQLHCTGNAPLPIYINMNPIASAHDLSPVKFSAQAHSTSELLRFL